MTKVLLMFFSATGNTAKMAEIIKEKLLRQNVDVTCHDITSYAHRIKLIDLEPFDNIIFGFPVYSLRAPRVCREWLASMDGRGKKCSVFFTYGGFGKDPAHYFIKQLLDKQNFELVSTAEFLGAHTFNYGGWKAVKGRPKRSDFAVAEEYVNKTLQKFWSEDSGIITKFEKPEYSVEQFDQAEKFRFTIVTQIPTRNGKACSMCGLCEKLCPTQAIDGTHGIADSSKCIACLRCIANCPEHVLSINDLSQSWPKKLEFHRTTEEELEHLESRFFL